MPNFIQREFDNIKKGGPTAYASLFFRLTQVLSIFGMILIIISTQFNLLLLGVNSLILPILSIAVAEYGIRSIEQRPIYAFYIGLVFTVIDLFCSPIGTLMALFGVYSFMNRDFRKLLGEQRPEWSETIVLKIKEIF